MKSRLIGERFRRTATTSRATTAIRDFDTRNTLVGYVNYDLPKFGGPKLLTKGWALNTAYSFKGGQPITVYNSTDSSGTNEGVQRPNVAGNPLAGVSHELQKPAGDTPYVQWLNTNAYSQPADGTWGNVSRNNVFGPGFADIDFSVLKNTEINIHDFPSTRSSGRRCITCSTAMNLASPACTQLCNDYWDGRADLRAASAQPVRPSVRATSRRASARANRSTCSWR